MRSGKLRPLGVSSPKRLAQLPDIPPVAETVPGYELVGWAGLMAPVRTPREVVEAVHRAAVAALAKPEVGKRLEDTGVVAAAGRPEDMLAYVKAEIAKYAKIIRDIDMPLQ
jgi:tripartite-type tricarboxylate transporter receptor subunit TctC